MNNYKIGDTDVKKLCDALTTNKNKYSPNKYIIRKNNNLSSLIDDKSIYISNVNGDKNDMYVINSEEEGYISVKNKAFLDLSPSFKKGNIQTCSIFKPNSKNDEVIPSEDLIYTYNKCDDKNITIYRNKDNPNTVFCELIDGEYKNNLYYTTENTSSLYRATNEAIELWLTDKKSLTTPQFPSLCIETLFKNRFHCQEEQSPEVIEALNEFSSNFATNEKKDTKDTKYVKPQKRKYSSNFKFNTSPSQQLSEESKRHLKYFKEILEDPNTKFTYGSNKDTNIDIEK